MIILFHQNDPTTVVGGIERYILTLLGQGGSHRVRLVACGEGRQTSDTLLLPCVPIPLLPKWVLFILAITRNAASVRRYLRQFPEVSYEFSRPEYWPVAFFLRGRRTFTIHGTGSDPRGLIRRKLYDLHSFLLPFVADAVHVVGRDISGLPPGVIRRLGSRIRVLDAWYDECFRYQPVPLDGVVRIIYAGRIVDQKNPELLFDVVRLLAKRLPDKFQFTYCGSDIQKVPGDIVNTSFFRYTGGLAAQELASEIAKHHVSLLCSRYGEGSPFIVIETLACGRAFVLPPLAGLIESYRDIPGTRIASAYTVESFANAVLDAYNWITTPGHGLLVAESVQSRAKGRAAEKLLQVLAGLAHCDD